MATESASPSPYVVCAVCVATSDFDYAFHALPKDPTQGQENVPIKASHRSMTQGAAVEFIEKFFGSCVGAAALVCVDAAHPKSVEAARNYADHANQARRCNGAPEVSTATHMYVRLASEAFFNGWAAASKAIGRMISTVDVVLDRQGMNEVERKKIVDWTRESASFRGRGFEIAGFHWKSIADEPLLLLPDHLAGIVRRHADRRDLPDAMAAIREWKSRGRIHIQNNVKFETQPPSRGEDGPQRTVNPAAPQSA